MKKSVILAAIIALLSACTTVDQKNASLQQEWSSETNAFAELKPVATQECGYKEGQKRERKKAVQMAECLSNLIEKRIIPYAKYPDLLRDQYPQDMLRAEEYANGRISYEIFKKRGEELSVDYETKWIARANSELAQAAEDSNNGQILGQMLLGGVQGYNKGAQKRQEEYERTRPIHCTTAGNTATCYQY